MKIILSPSDVGKIILAALDEEDSALDLLNKLSKPGASSSGYEVKINPDGSADVSRKDFDFTQVRG